MAGRPFAVAIYGATGFTGGLVAEYFATRGGDLRFAIAGRSESKLRAVADRLYAINPALRGPLGILVDTAGAGSVVRQARVVITTVGPFTLHGETVLSACIAEGTHYIDSTGEFSWVKNMEVKYGEAARAKGLILVPMSGFDSIPSDLGAFLVVRKARQEFAATVGVRQIGGFMALKGSASGGTIASMIEIARSPLKHVGALAFAPVGMSNADAARIVDVNAPKGLLPGWASAVRKWQHVFIMSFANAVVVKRSAAILADRGAAIAKAEGVGKVDGALPQSQSGYCASAPFSYTEVQTTKSIIQACIVTLSIFILGLFMACVRFMPASLLAIVRRTLPQPGTGPSAAARASAHFTMELVGVTDEAAPRAVRVRIGGGDPGYTETAKMLAESALCITEGSSKAMLPGQALGGGFLTPATAFGSVLQRRLQRAGMHFTWALSSPNEPPAANAWKEFE